MAPLVRFALMCMSFLRVQAEPVRVKVLTSSCKNTEIYFQETIDRMDQVGFKYLAHSLTLSTSSLPQCIVIITFSDQRNATKCEVIAPTYKQTDALSMSYLRGSEH
jgi:uncharacterized protein (DUF1330 family)